MGKVPAFIQGLGTHTLGARGGNGGGGVNAAQESEGAQQLWFKSQIPWDSLPCLLSQARSRAGVSEGSTDPHFEGLKHGHGLQMGKGGRCLQPVLLASGTLSNSELVTTPRASPVPSALQRHS